ncbi:hypothetical protein GDO86_014172 [Hymenochirus boettgeri]|uniref:Cyclin N-terminal domain containing 1 n=1 Tax=Hymenochirus boettgeri TaxID=247094 RepID=A0A8T2JTH4_9PIPI|nr:hypothetical protein GDO86_014172 [Hymenochirus boettgeri]
MAKKRFPTSPRFEFGIVSADIIEDVLIDLAKENEQCLANLSEYAGTFKDPRIIEIVFILSEVWCQDNSTKYQAVEILDRYKEIHICRNDKKFLHKTSKEYRETLLSDTTLSEPWSLLKVHLSKTFMLRLTSCFQVASKLSFHCHVIDNNTVQKFLQSVGFTYSKVEILKSELTVLNTLDFHVNLLSPFSYVELLLEVLGHNGCSLSLKHLREMCILILDLVYLLKSSIYDMILKASIEFPSPNNLQRKKFMPVKEDQMLLATGIISASALILRENSWNKV